MRETLAAWGDANIVRPLSGGNRNAVTEIRLEGRRLVARQSRRPAASLDWEASLLGHLAQHGLRVPAVVPTRDGRSHVAGVMVLTWLDGMPPGPADWPAVVAALRRLHDLTADWPQRPGFRSTTELITADAGGDVDLTAMPADAAADCRLAWAALAGTPTAVVHGDPGPANIRISPAGVGLLDWDEARRDHTDLDLVQLPGTLLPPARRAAASIAAAAWEAANGWLVEPSYARRQLARLRAMG
jgi:Ser/Thr protein kinase RdoA (MazF antagonist)